MRKINLLLVACLLLGTMSAKAQKSTDAYYQTHLTDLNEAFSRGDRHVDAIKLTGNSNVAVPNDKKMYHGFLGWEEGFTVSAGAEVTPGIGWTGGWMHGYVYLDKDNNGSFDIPDVDSYEEGTDANELVSYTFYSASQSETGKNSAGQSVSNGAGITADNLPAFTLPSTPGFYRMRSKVDWNDINAKSERSDFKANGGQYVDVRLHVKGTDSNLSAETTHCSVTNEDGSALSTAVTNGAAHTIKITPEAGCVLSVMKVRYGYNLEGEASPFNGDMAYWQEVVIEEDALTSNGDGTYSYEISADYTQYDVKVIVTYDTPAKAQLLTKIEELQGKVAGAVVMVGATSPNAVSAANEAIVAAQTVYNQEDATLADVNDAISAIGNAITAFDTATPLALEAGQVYMLINAKNSWNRGKSMYSGYEVTEIGDLRWGDKQPAKNTHYWVLESINGNTYKIKNGDGSYIHGAEGAPNAENTTPNALSMTNDLAQASSAEFSTGHVDKSWYIKVNGLQSAHVNGHGSNQSGDVICWAGGDNTESSWYIYPISADYTIYNVAITGEAPEGAKVSYSNGDGAKNGGFLVVPTSEANPTFTAQEVDGYISDMTTVGNTITVNYTLQSYIYYTLTDQAGNTYTGSKPGTAGNDATLDDVRGGFTLSDIVWNGDNVTATITFPIPVSKVDGATNMTMISSFSNDAYKWYADGTSVKSKKNAMPTSEDVMKYLWAIYPSRNNGTFTFTIKNIATDKYINSTSTENSHDEGKVILSQTASPLTVDGDQFKLSTGKYLSLNSTNVSDGEIQTIGTWGSHNGTHNDFPDPAYNLTISEVGAATLYTPFAVTIPEGVTAKYIKAADNSTANGGRLYYTTLEGEIPANTAVVLVGTGEKTFTATTEEVPAVTDNMLFGYSKVQAVAESDYTGTGETGTVYALGNNNGTAVFGHFTGANYKAGKAYLDASKLSGVNNVRYFYIFDEDMETGIDNIEGTEGAENGNAAIYDMSGRRVGKASKGIYIINGKKVIR